MAARLGRLLSGTTSMMIATAPQTTPVTLTAEKRSLPIAVATA